MRTALEVARPAATSCASSSSARDDPRAVRRVGRGAPGRASATTCARARSSSGSCRTIRSSSAARCPEREVPALHAGPGGARHASTPYPGETFTGRVARVGAASDPTARSLAFEALVPNADHRLRPGLLRPRRRRRRAGRARGRGAAQRASRTFAGVTKVFVVEDGVAHEREVTLGVDLGDGWVEIAQRRGPRAAGRDQRPRRASPTARRSSCAPTRRRAPERPMRFADVCIRRPVFATMLIAAARRARPVLVPRRSASTSSPTSTSRSSPSPRR